ncbi:phytanoyl-CoA dioxygenase family protein [Micromonospora sp. NBC_01699]|uniref:phytanoyl-CoA dioxygenase family protein n=1 Tax=Micromonospora sp. NBC_01699 TaxID=2975984 RepID=UPI002E2D63F6|nr:phytanoyl-CoA dioxygenase family protein [Micromonospora sp. NBC_01699]
MTSPSNYAFDHLFGLLSVFPFLWKRRRYYRRLRRETPTGRAAEAVRTLQRDGIVVLEGLLSEENLEQIRQAMPPIEAMTLSPEGDRSLMYLDADRIPAFAPFFENQLVKDVVRGQLSKQAYPLRRTIGLKKERGDFPTFETNYHMDTWKHRTKVFLFVDDVTEENAPMIYLRGSHRGFWRRWAEYRIFRWYRTAENGYAGRDTDLYFLGSFWPHEVRQLKADYGFEDLLCVGKAGTAIVFDGRGLHRATPLRDRHRLILTSYWIHPDDHT